MLKNKRNIVKNWQLLMIIIGLWLGITKIGSTQLIDQNWIKTHARDHIVAGAVLDNIVRGPWIAADWRKHAWQRTTWVFVINGVYEGIQRYEFHGNYPWKYMILDTSVAYAAAWISEGLVSLILK